MAKQLEKIFWSEEEKLAIVMRAIELRMHKMWDSPLHVLRASMTALPADRRRKVRSLAEAPLFVELHDKMLSERLIRHKGIGSRSWLPWPKAGGSNTRRGWCSTRLSARPCAS